MLETWLVKKLSLIAPVNPWKIEVYVIKVTDRTFHRFTRIVNLFRCWETIRKKHWKLETSALKLFTVVNLHYQLSWWNWIITLIRFKGRGKKILKKWLGWVLRGLHFFLWLYLTFFVELKKPLRVSNLQRFPCNNSSYDQSNLFELCKPIINNWMMLIGREL